MGWGRSGYGKGYGRKSYGSYGSCYKCGRKGHWMDGSAGRRNRNGSTTIYVYTLAAAPGRWQTRADRPQRS